MQQAISTKTLTQAQRIKGLTAAFKYFARSLKYTSKAQAYLQSRAIDYHKIIAGYDNHNFHQAKAAGKELQELYLALGLIYPDKLGRTGCYHSRFDSCIVLPSFDEQGNIVYLEGRKTDAAENEGGPHTIPTSRELRGKHYKLPGGHQGLYPGYPKPGTEILLITEKVLDCATLVQYEFITSQYTLLSLYGAEIWTPEHSQAIENLHQLKEVIFALDGDKAGKEGTHKHTETLLKINPKLKISYLDIPDKEDINSLAQGHEPELFTELINNRKFLFSIEKKKELLGGNGQPANTTITTNDARRANDPDTLPWLNKEIHYGAGLMTNDTITGKLNTTNPDNITYETEELQITIWGGIELHNLKRLRVTLHIQLKPALSGAEWANIYQDYRDTIDLYSNSGRKKLIQELSEEFEINSQTINKIITDLTNQLEQYRQQKREQQIKKAEELKNKDKETFTPEEMRAGEKLLKEKDLMNKTYNDIKQIGLIGQEKNGMLLFFIYLTRMFKEPLHALIQGKSGSGKTYLLKKIIALIPKLHYKNITAITENALYHVFAGVLKHIILLLEDLEGSYGALLPIRELMTNLSISKWTTITNHKTGEPEQKELYVEGPVCIAGATTKDRIYEDNANRSFQIQIEENPNKEKMILAHQRKQAAGLIDKTVEENIQTTFKTAQLQLKKIEVIIPFANELIIPEYVFKKYRTNQHYLTLIKSITFWHQKQRQWKKDKQGSYYIESNFEDVHWANQLCKESLLRKSDELSPQLRAFFERLKDHLNHHNINPEAGSFYAKETRQAFRMNPMQVNRYLRELDARNYIKKAGGNQKTGYEYMIKLWDDYKELQQGIDILDELLEKLKKKYNTKKNGNKQV